MTTVREKLLNNISRIPGVTPHHKAEVRETINGNNKIRVYGMSRILGNNHIVAMTHAIGQPTINQMKNMKKRVTNMNNQQISEVLSNAYFIGQRLHISPNIVTKRYIFERGVNNRTHNQVMGHLKSLNRARYINLANTINLVLRHI
jgi:hypothetical protein